MTCARIRLDAATTVIFVRDGWLIVEVADSAALRSQLDQASGDRLLSVSEVSERTGFTPGAVRAWIARSALKAVRVGKEYRVRESDLNRFLDGAKEDRVQLPARGGRRRKPVVA